MKRALKNLAKRFLDITVVPLAHYLGRRFPDTTVQRELEKMAVIESAAFVQENMPAALQFSRKQELWDHSASCVSGSGLKVEFGVWSGTSINHFAKIFAPAVVFGFDSFEGLREDWAGSDLRKGYFDRGGRMPAVSSNVLLIKGWFDETLPSFLKENRKPFSFVHIDCDTYDASKAVFDLIGDRVQVGTVIVFDEYIAYRGWKIGEFKAWQEFSLRHGIEFQYLAFSNQTVSLKVTRVR